METIAIQAAIALLVPLMGALATWLVAYLVKYLKTKTGIELTEAQQRQLQEFAAWAVKMAEEKAASLFKKDSVKMTSEQKFRYAVETIKDFVPKLRKDEAKAETYILGAVAMAPDLGTTAKGGM